MQKDTNFEEAEKAAKAIHEKFIDLFKRGFLDSLEPAIRKAVAGVRTSQSISLTIQVAAFDIDRGREVVVQEFGSAYGADGTQYDFSSADALSRYISDGRIIAIPNTICPNCWGSWDFKQVNHKCDSCGFRLGERVKYLIDDNTCPWCREGQITSENPTCNVCGNKIDLKFVTWG